MLADIDQVETEALSSLAAAEADAVEAWRIEWLGSKGRLKSMMSQMKDLDPSDRPAFGQRMNALKESL